MKNTNQIFRFMLTCLLLLVVTASIHAQKTTLSGDTILVDGTPYALLKKTGKGLLLNLQLLTLSGREVAKITVSNIPAKNPSRPNEVINFWTFEFLGDDFFGGCELELSNKKKLAELIVFYKLIEEGEKVNPEAAKYFVEKFGHPYTKPDEKKEDKK